jgi:hypothetical protein
VRVEESSFCAAVWRFIVEVGTDDDGQRWVVWSVEEGVVVVGVVSSIHGCEHSMLTHSCIT